MKKILQKIGVTIFATFVSTGAWSQCPTVICPTNIEVASDTLTCSAVVNYAIPEGIDICNLTTVTYNFTGTIDTWVVPAGVTQVTIEASGAAGATSTASAVAGGLGATMIGDFTVTPGETISILVGEQYSATDANGGGGGTFVIDALNNPLVIAGGGGGSSGSVDSPDKHGQVGTTGGTGAGGGGLGGTAGSGGSIGASFASGGGGGFLTDGADGWTANSGGDAYVNGGAGANVGFGIGGFGGGGNGSGNQVGGGGGGYSGGGGASNSGGAGVGGGGGSINNGTNQMNTGGANSGNGMVIITYGGATTTTLLSGIGSGGTFPEGVSIESYAVVNAFGDSAFCSFTVTVLDSIVPTVVCPSDVVSCNPVVNGIAPTSADNCGSVTVNYNLTGATTGAGSTDASGETFEVGVTTVWYIATDASGNQDSSSFMVTVNPLPVVTIATFVTDTVCVNSPSIVLPIGTPASGTYSGNGVSGGDFDPAIAGNGTHWVVYSYTDTSGCLNSDSTGIFVDGCAGLNEVVVFSGLKIYPNPSTGIYNLQFNNLAKDKMEIEITDVNGRNTFSKTIDSQFINETIDLRNEANGVYFLKVSSETQSNTYKIVKN